MYSLNKTTMLRQLGQIRPIRSVSPSITQLPSYQTISKRNVSSKELTPKQLPTDFPLMSEKTASSPIDYALTSLDTIANWARKSSFWPVTSD